jgi:UPF0755 protein
MDDWQDPFTDDEAARERERRRAEREARRRARRQELADKVAAERDRAAAPTQTAPSAEAAPPRRPLAGRLSDDVLLRRRIIGAVALAFVIGLVAVGVVALADQLGGDDGSAPSPAAAKSSELTIPEGLDISQIADVAKEAGLRGDYERTSRNFKGFNPSEYGADDPPSLEGFLFPATYELPRKPTVDDLISRQLQAFEDNIAGVDLSYAESKNLNVYDVLKIASMVEREIQVPEERRLAAAVIYNRLAAGDFLGIDATIRYEDGNYDEQLTESRLAEDTPYNTRTNPGLPPTPIGNPGLASIKAAANPARSDAYYFVVKPGTCGEHVFVESEEEFAQAEEEYQAALQEQGGSPTEC